MHVRTTIASGAALGALLLSAAVVPAAAGSARPLSDRMISVLSVTARSEIQNADGSVTDAWTVDGIPVSVTGPSQMVVTADLKLVGGLHQLRVGATPATQVKTTSSRSPNSYVYRSWCITLTPSNGYGRSCDVQNVVYQNGADWYLSDAMAMDAHYGNGLFSPSLRFMYTYAAWSANNSELDWDPRQTVNVGSCHLTQISAAVTNRGSVSEWWTACPNQYGPYTLTSRQFGSYWSGQSQSWQYVDAVDIVHDPPNASPGTTLFDGMSWS